MAASAPTMLEDICIPLTKPRWASWTTGRATRSRGIFRAFMMSFWEVLLNVSGRNPPGCKVKLNRGFRDELPANDRLVHGIEEAHSRLSPARPTCIGNAIRTRRGPGTR